MANNTLDEWHDKLAEDCYRNVHDIIFRGEPAALIDYWVTAIDRFITEYEPQTDDQADEERIKVLEDMRRQLAVIKVETLSERLESIRRRYLAGGDQSR